VLRLHNDVQRQCRKVTEISLVIFCNTEILESSGRFLSHNNEFAKQPRNV